MAVIHDVQVEPAWAEVVLSVDTSCWRVGGGGGRRLLLWLPEAFGWTRLNFLDLIQCGSSYCLTV